MDTTKFKSIAVPVADYKKLKTLSEEKFEMPQSMAKTNAFIIQQAFKEHERKNARSNRSQT
jgi:hypothetical protein